MKTNTFSQKEQPGLSQRSCFFFFMSCVNGSGADELGFTGCMTDLQLRSKRFFDELVLSISLMVIIIGPSRALHGS